MKYVEVGEKEGATLVYGGRRVDRPGELPIDVCECMKLMYYCEIFCCRVFLGACSIH